MDKLIGALIVIAVVIAILGFVLQLIGAVLLFLFNLFLYILQLLWLGVPGGLYGLLLGVSAYYLFKRSFAKGAISNNENQVLKKDSFNFGINKRLITANYNNKRKDVDDWVVTKLAASNEAEITMMIDSNARLGESLSKKELKEMKPPKVKMGIDSLLWFSMISICTLLVVPAYLYKNPEFITASALSLKQLTGIKSSRKTEAKKLTSTTSNSNSYSSATRLVNEQGTIKSSVNIRLSPNNKAKKIGVLSSGVRVRILGVNETKKWIRVRVLTSNLKGKTGYVFGKYVNRNAR